MWTEDGNLTERPSNDLVSGESSVYQWNPRNWFQCQVLGPGGQGGQDQVELLLLLLHQVQPGGLPHQSGAEPGPGGSLCGLGAAGDRLHGGENNSLWEHTHSHSHSNNGFSAQITCSLKTKKRLRSRKCREKNEITLEITRPVRLYENKDYDYWRPRLYSSFISSTFSKTSLHAIVSFV